MKYVLAHNGFFFGSYDSYSEAETALEKLLMIYDDDDDDWEIFDTFEDDDCDWE